MKIRLLLLTFLFLSLRGFSQCSLTVKITSSAQAICSGNSIALTAEATSGAGPYTYVWSTGETTKVINVNKAGKYTVTVSDKTPGCSPVTANYTATVSPVPDAPTAKGKTVCVGTTADLEATAPGGDYQWYDADGNFLISGAKYTTPPITGTTFFYVQTTVGGCTSLRTEVRVNVTGKPTITQATVCSGSRATLIVSGGDSYAWYATPTSTTILSQSDHFTTPVLTETKSYYVEAVINGCTSVRTKVTATVGAPPQPPVVQDPGSICSGSVVMLHADVPQGVVDWYSTPTGGTSIISSPDFTTPSLTANTTYYVQTTLGDCQSDRVPVTIKVNAIPTAPTPQSVPPVCYNGSTIITAGPASAGTYKWFDAPTGGHQLPGNATFNTPALTHNTTYYVMLTKNDCNSDRTPVTVTVNPPLPAPFVSAPFVCYGSVATLTPTSPNAAGSYEWYDKAVGGTRIFTGTSFVTPALTANTTYYVQVSANGCTSARSSVTVTVIPVVPVPTVTGTTTVCSGNITTLTATGSSGNYEWYDKATGGTLLSQSQVFESLPLTATTTYYIQAITNTCQSERKAVTVTVNPVPAQPIASGVTICPGRSAHLTATSATGNIAWYADATGGTPLATTNSFDTPPLSVNTSYYVESKQGDCGSTRKLVTVTVDNSGTTFHYSSGTYSKSGGDPAPIVANPSGGTYSASPAGLVFLSNTTGQIDVSASAPGTYVVTLTSPGTCSGTYSTTVRIADVPSTGFHYEGPYCQDDVNPSPVFGTGSTPGLFSASPAGLHFANNHTGEIDLPTTTPGTYTITNTIPTLPGDPEISSSTTVTIAEKVTVNAGPDQKLQIGSVVHLTGTVSKGGGRWSGGGGVFSDPNSKTTDYTPAAGETSVVLSFISVNNTAPCGAAKDNVQIDFFTTPPAPTALDVPVCEGNVATLSAVAPGGIYEWYDQPTGGTRLQTGPVYKISGLTVTTTFYVQTTINGLTSPRTAVKAIIGSTSVAPVVTGERNICSGSPAMLTATGSTGSYEWYDVPVGGQRLWLTDKYVTPPLNVNTTYYVQSVIGNCISPRTKVDITVSPIPTITSRGSDIVCSGNALDYTITADMPNSTFSYDRAAVAGITNPAVTGQTSATITEKLINTSSSPIDVTYMITAKTGGGCSGAPYPYVVTVNPTPEIKDNAPQPPICSGTASNYQIAFNTGASFNWSRAAVAGISNAAVSGQSASVIKEVLYNTTAAPIDVHYSIVFKTSSCDGIPFDLTIKVNPSAIITSDPFGSTCSDSPVNYQIKSNLKEPVVTFSWSRAAVNNISNPEMPDHVAPSLIDEKLINTGANAVNVTYIITPIAYGCPGKPFMYIIAVAPQPVIPELKTNTPVCVGKTIILSTTPVRNATYIWTGPNNFKTETQNPELQIKAVTQADEGKYYLSVKVNDCISPLSTPKQVAVNALPKADAGPSGVFCITTTSIPLDGKVEGGTTTGIWSSSSDNKNFTGPLNSLVNEYIPSAVDKANKKVTLTLTTTSKDNCNIDTSDRVIIFGTTPGSDAGDVPPICAQDTRVALSGKILIPGGTGRWSSPNGNDELRFLPSPNQTSNDDKIYYVPTAEDVQKGSVTLTLTANASGQCFTPDSKVVITLIPPPTVDAGGTRYVLKGHTITLNPKVSDENVTYKWTPNINISDVNIKNPVVTGEAEQVYTVSITDSRGCTNSSNTTIKVAPVLNVPNTFTPNGDGVNDLWDITGLVAYENANVDIFNRYGAKVFHSKGYGTAWDGKYNGQPVPPGVYYYIIDTKMFGQVLTGNVTIIR